MGRGAIQGRRMSRAVTDTRLRHPAGSFHNPLALPDHRAASRGTWAAAFENEARGSMPLATGTGPFCSPPTGRFRRSRSHGYADQKPLYPIGSGSSSASPPRKHRRSMQSGRPPPGAASRKPREMSKPISRRASPPRRLCRARSRTKLRGIADLPRNGQAGRRALWVAAEISNGPE